MHTSHTFAGTAPIFRTQRRECGSEFRRKESLVERLWNEYALSKGNYRQSWRKEFSVWNEGDGMVAGWGRVDTDSGRSGWKHEWGRRKREIGAFCSIYPAFPAQAILDECFALLPTVDPPRRGKSHRTGRLRRVSSHALLNEA